MEPKIATVSQINGYVKKILDHNIILNNVWIKGEISNFKHHYSGHLYITLKDEGGVLKAVMFRGSAQSLNFEPSDGMKVLARGRISVYEAGGSYQLYIEEMIPDGVGELYIAYEQLKKQLEEEGLFRPEHKKPIPKFPKRVGVVTASTGAAVRDIINVITRRYPMAEIVIYPAQVQGVGAAESVVKAIEYFNATNEVDTLIVGRGGGSIEDLWAFNEENVARAIYEAKTPIISGTGHEVDTTIADYAADLRAATPTAACELAVPDITEVMEGIANREYTMAALLKQIIRRYQMKLQKYQITIVNYDPRFQLQEQKMRLSELEEQIQQVMKNKMTGYKHKLELYAKELHGLSPTAKLINGFGYLEDQNGEPVTSVHKVKEGDQISLTISDGTILAMAKQIRTMDEKGK